MRAAPEVTEIVLAGDLDLATRGQVLRGLERVLAGRPEQVLIDLSSVHFVDSGAVALLDWAYLQVDCDPARMSIASPNRQPSRILSLTRRQRSLPVFPSRASALAVLTRSRSRSRSGDSLRLSA